MGGFLHIKKKGEVIMILEKDFNIRKFIKEIIGTLIGSLIIAFGIALFLVPNKLSIGGFTGLATITYYLLNVPIGTFTLILNIPLFLLAIYKMGKSFFVKSLIGTISLSFFIDLLGRYEALTTDRFLACIYGGIIIGIGTAIIFKMDSSTGGSDTISFLAKSFSPHVRMGSVMVIIDSVIVLLNMIFFKEIEVGLYSAIAIFLMGKMVDLIFEGVDFTKLLVIISDKSEEISKEIGDRVNRGTTGLFGKGMYKKQDKLVLLCAASRGDISKIKTIVREIDPYSFIVVANAREVLGLGFDREKEVKQ